MGEPKRGSCLFWVLFICCFGISNSLPDTSTWICSFNKPLLITYFPYGSGTMDTEMPPALGGHSGRGGDMHAHHHKPVGAADDLYQPSLGVVVQNVKGHFFKDVTFE